MPLPLPAGIVPVQNLTTEQILYGTRNTRYRYELLTHDLTTGRDLLAGELDGVISGTLTASSAGTVKKTGSLRVADLPQAAGGKTRIADVDFVACRVRPVRVTGGLPDVPLGVYLVTASPDEWNSTHREVPVELHDITTVLVQDKTDTAFTANTNTPILGIIGQIVSSANEHITIDSSNSQTLSSPMVWPPGTPKITIINELLKVLDYRSLWVDGVGNFRATPNILPTKRPTHYTVLKNTSGAALERKLVDGDSSIYVPEWVREKDYYQIPNKVVTVSTGSEDAPPLSGVWTNDDPTSPFSRLIADPNSPGQYVRTRWVVETVDGVEVPDFSGTANPTLATVEFLNNRARASLIGMSSVQASVKLTCLPIPIDLLDVVIFQNTPAGVNARHTVTRWELDLSYNGLMGLDLRETVNL